MNRYEQQVIEATYPARLPVAVTRLLAAKLMELEEARHNEQRVLQLSSANFSETMIQVKDLSALPDDVRRDHEALLELRAKERKIAERLSNAGYSTSYYDGIYRNATPEEIAAVRATHNAKLVAVDERWKAQREQLWGVAQRLAAEQIKVVQSKINPETLKLVESIGQPALPPAKEDA